jgi:hypothetical protein
MNASIRADAIGKEAEKSAIVAFMVISDRPGASGPATSKGDVTVAT